MNSEHPSPPTPTLPERRTASDEVTIAVVAAVADAEEVSPLELSPLAATIDPDALERVVASMRGCPDGPTGCVEFPYEGYVVTVTGAGDVDVRRRTDRG